MKKLTELNTQAQEVFSLINTEESIARLSPKEEFQELFDWVVSTVMPCKLEDAEQTREGEYRAYLKWAFNKYPAPHLLLSYLLKHNEQLLQ